MKISGLLLGEDVRMLELTQVHSQVELCAGQDGREKVSLCWLISMRRRISYSCTLFGQYQGLNLGHIR